MIEKILEPPLIINLEEPITKVASKMFSEKKYEALVFEKNEFLGIISARDLVLKKITNPEETKAKSFLRKNIPVISLERSLEEIINIMLTNELRSIPVKKDNEFYTISKIDLLKIIPKTYFKNKKTKDLMIFPICVSLNDNLATVKSILRDLNISRVVVLNEKDEIQGIIDILSLLKTIIPRYRETLGEEAGEKKDLDKILISSFVERCEKANPETSLHQIINLITSKKSPVLIEKNNKVAGIITPKILLKLVGKKFEKIYINISGIKDEDPFIKSFVEKEIKILIEKVGKILPIDSLITHIEKHTKGGKTRYEVSTRLYTEKGNFHSYDEDLDLTKAIGKVIDRIEREVIDKKERIKF